VKTFEELQISGSDNFSVSLDVNAVVESWLTRTVNPSLRRSNDIRNDKSKAVFDFLIFAENRLKRFYPAMSKNGAGA